MFISPNDLALNTENASSLVGPQEVFCVKGWNRSCCGLLVLLAVFEMQNLLEARSFGVIYCTVVSGDLADVALENVAACAAAYQVGRTEAGAATNLFKMVSIETKTALKELVRLGIQIQWVFMNRHADADLMVMLQNSVPPADVEKVDDDKLAKAAEPHGGGLDLLYLSSRYEKGKEAVQQRGIAATQDIIAKLLEGLQLNDGHPVLVVDCVPNRFAEWSAACSNMQLKALVEDSKAPSDLDSKVAAAKTISQALKGAGEPPVSSTQGIQGNDTGSGGQDRTVASPDFGDDAIPDTEKRVNFETKTLDEFNASKTLLD
eukprot:s2702_g14.t1